MNPRPHISRAMFPLLMASMLGANGHSLIDDIGREMKLDRPKTPQDLARIAAAEAKRERRAMLKARQSQPAP